MRGGSVFSGIGGFDLGFERAGIEVAWQVEIDDYRRAVLERHFPHAARFRDVREVHGALAHGNRGRRREHAQRNGASAEAVIGSRGHDASGCCLPPIDILFGGVPCQPASVAGKRQGAADDRWLWPEFLRLVRELRPRWVVAENPPGILSVDAGRAFGDILRELAACGYVVEWDRVAAAAVGAPHLRERIFIVAYSDGSRVTQSAIQYADISTKSGASTAAGEMAYADSFGARERSRSDAEPAQPGTLRGRRDSSDSQDALAHAHAGGDVPDAARGRREQRNGLERTAPEIELVWPHPADSGHWPPLPCLGVAPDGLPCRLDVDHERWECGYPRTIPRQQGRTKALAALGDAVVPAVAEYIGRMIMEAADA